MADEQKAVLVSVDVDTSQAQKNVDKLTKSIEENKEEIRLAKKEMKEMGSRTEENASRWDHLSKVIAANQVQNSKLNTQRRNSIKLMKSEKGSMNQLSAELSDLTRQRKELDTTTEEGAAKFEELTAKIKEYSDSLGEAEQAGGSFGRNVGNYANDAKEGAEAMGDLVQGTEEMAVAQKILNTVMKANPILAVIGIITGLLAAFTKTEEGAKKFEIVMTVINTTFETLIGWLGEAGGAIVSVFEDPLGSLENFGKSLKSFVSDRIEQLLEGLGHLGKAIKHLFKGEFEEAMDAAKEGGKDLFQTLTPVGLAYKALEGAIDDVIDKTKENIKRNVEATVSARLLKEATIELTTANAKLEGQIAKQAILADDATLSFNDQRKAQEKQMELEAELYTNRQTQIKGEIALMKAKLESDKNNGFDTIELRQQIADKEAESIRLTEEHNAGLTAHTKQERQRRQDEWEQELDFIIDIGEKFRKPFEKAATNADLTLEQRTEALGKYHESIDQWIRDTRQTFEETGLSEEEWNELRGITDPRVLADHITAMEDMSEIEKNRLREDLIEYHNAMEEKKEVDEAYEKANIESQKRIDAAKEKSKKKDEKDAEEAARKKIALTTATTTAVTAILSLASQFLDSENEKQFKAQKALALSTVAIDTGVGIMKAFTTNEPLFATKAANAIAVGAAGAAQAVGIAQQKFDGGGSSSPSLPDFSSVGGNQDIRPETPNIDQANQVELLTEALGNLNIAVDVREITTAQNKVSVAEGLNNL